MPILRTRRIEINFRCVGLNKCFNQRHLSAGVLYRQTPARRRCYRGMQMTRQTSPPPLPLRPKDGHKGMFGRVLIVGGGELAVYGPSHRRGAPAVRLIGENPNALQSGWDVAEEGVPSPPWSCHPSLRGRDPYR